MHMQAHMDMFSLYKNWHSQSFERTKIRDSVKEAGYHRFIEYSELEDTHTDHQVRISKINNTTTMRNSAQELSFASFQETLEHCT